MTHTFTQALITGDTCVRLHRLAVRKDGDAWIVGRAESGDFIAVPALGYHAIELLGSGHSITATRRQLQEASGDDVDIAAFVTDLLELGFVAAVDDHQLVQQDPPPPSLAWLKPHHVRWLTHPATTIAAGLLILLGLATVAARPWLIPSYHDLIWSRHGSLVIAGNAAITWTIIYLHELAHLATARAAGVPGRIGLSTRLQFLAAQTDVSAIWAAPRRVRLTVYLAGIALNLLTATAGVLLLAVAQPHGLTRHLTTVTVLICLLFIPPQLMVFMRTDLYFLLQDLTGSANLYADGAAYLRYQNARLRQWIRPTSTTLHDPTGKLPPRQRRTIRAYCLILLTGTTVSLAIAATITLPAALTLIIHAATTIITGRTGWPLTDAITVIATTGGFQILWARTWWRRHGHRIRDHLSNRNIQRRREGSHGEDRDPQARQDRNHTAE